MISDRDPALSQTADEVLDHYLDGVLRRKKRDQRLRRIVVSLPPKWCGCTTCINFEKMQRRIDSVPDSVPENI